MENLKRKIKSQLDILPEKDKRLALEYLNKEDYESLNLLLKNPDVVKKINNDSQELDEFIKLQLNVLDLYCSCKESFEEDEDDYDDYLISGYLKD